MDETSLILAQYRMSDRLQGDNPGIVRRWSNKIEEGKSLLFVIAIEEWDWSEYRTQLGPDHPVRTFSASVHFRCENGMEVKVAPFFKYSTTVEEMEQFFYNMYLTMSGTREKIISEIKMEMESKNFSEERKQEGLGFLSPDVCKFVPKEE